ncbi:MAG: ornithine carbamoyltransferase [Candidatus Omnitrophota bacterium]
MLKSKDLISTADLSLGEINEIFELASKLKKGTVKGNLLAGKTLCLIFQKPSNRTKVSFAVGMSQLGGYTVYLGPDEVKMGTRESSKDVARVISRYAQGVVARTFKHSDIIELAENADIPVINGLSDFLHPCQALSDLFTIKEKSKNFKNVKLAYVGDGNNVLHSLMLVCSKLGVKLAIAVPKGYEPKKEVMKTALEFAKKSSGSIELFHQPEKAVAGADFIYTDVWASMGKEAEYEKRKKIFKPFQINAALLKKNGGKALVMHCLPAHRGDEITDEVIDSKQSIVYDQAENRLHAQKAILVLLLKK